VDGDKRGSKKKTAANLRHHRQQPVNSNHWQMNYMLNSSLLLLWWSFALFMILGFGIFLLVFQHLQ
jgi:hypothetical protein